MVTPPDRRFRHPWLAVAALLALAVWAARPAVAAGTLVGISMAVHPGDAASGQFGCCKQQMSADGRWVVFRSQGRELVNGYTGSGLQIYLFDRQTGAVRLASGVWSSPTQGAGANSQGQVVSADGAFVAFDSSAANLVAGGSGPVARNVYLWERATGSVILVSHSAAAAGQRGNALSVEPVISADGAFVAFLSSATDLVAGGSGPGSPNVYLWERATGTVTLVSESTTATGQRGNNSSYAPMISADGAFVAFTSEATDLVAGGSGPGTRNVYLWERATGTATLVSESTAAAGQRGDNSSLEPTISGDGAFVAFLSSATDLVAGGSGPGNPNVYLWERATGTATLVSESTTAAGQRGNNQSFEPVISADGAFVAFSSFATDLVAGGGPGTRNVYLWERATGTATLVSQSAAAAGQRGNANSTTPAISAGGAFVAFTSSATDLVAGSSGLPLSNVYRWERATGTVTLVTESTAAAGQRGNKGSGLPAISADGAFVAFQSDATDLVAGDTQFTDVLVAEVATGGMVVASRRAPDIPWDPPTANNVSEGPSISADGAFVAFYSIATDLVAGNSGLWTYNVYLWERATGMVTLVSHSFAAAGQRGNDNSWGPVISADGAFVAFYSRATDLVAGSSGPAPVQNIYLWERATGIVTLVSHAAAAAGQRSSGLDPVISAAGDFVAFLSYSTDLVAGGSGPALVQNVYLWERATGTVTLVSESAAAAGQRGNNTSFLAVISADGAFVAFASNATDLVSGGGPATANIYLYERATGSLTLVSGSTAVAGQRGNGHSSWSVISAGGAFVAFSSHATDLVLGGSGPATSNIYLWERATGTATLVSHSAAGAGQRGNDLSELPKISADGAFVAFTSLATDLVAGGSGPAAENVYLWERATGTVTLISESTAAAGQRGNARSHSPSISAGGAFVAFRSLATDLVAGGSGPATGRPDGELPQPPMPFNVYLWERATGAVTLVSQSTAGAGQRGNSESSGPVIGADGASVAFSSLSSDLIARDLNGQSDVFHWAAPGGPLFADGFESGDTVRWSGSTAPVSAAPGPRSRRARKARVVPDR
jgi:hypothetical protein